MAEAVHLKNLFYPLIKNALLLRKPPGMNEVLPVPHSEISSSAALPNVQKLPNRWIRSRFPPRSSADCATYSTPLTQKGNHRYTFLPLLLSLSHPVPTLPPLCSVYALPAARVEGFFVHALFSVCFAPECVCGESRHAGIDTTHILFAARAGGDSPCLPVVMHYI